MDSVEHAQLKARVEAVNPTNTIETNLKDMALNKLEISQRGLTSELWNIVNNIATQCWFEAGPAVYEARAILTADSLQLYGHNWEAGCTTAKKWAGNASNEPKEIPIAIVDEPLADYRLIPNLINGSMDANIYLGIEEVGTVLLYNLAGGVEGKYAIKEGLNTIPLRKLNLANGMYIYKVWVNNELVRTDKLIKIQ